MQTTSSMTHPPTTLRWYDYLLFGFVTALMVVVGIAYPPYSSIVVLAAAMGGAILLARPDVAFMLYFAVENLFSEDILLHTEKLEVTIYRVNLPYIGINIFEAMLILLVIVTLLQRRGVIWGTRLDFSMAFFGLLCLVGYITCIRLYGDSARLFEPRRLLHFFGAYYLAVNLFRTKESLKMFLWIYFLALIFKSLEGVYLYTAGEGLQIKWKIRAIFTGWGDSLSFLTYLLILGVFVVERVSFPLKRLFILLTPAIFFSFLFSYKRAYYVALIAGICALFWFQGRRTRFRLIILLLIGAVIMMGLITVAGQWTAIGMRFESILNPTKESSANYRLVEWHNAMISIHKNPLWGIGLGGVMPMEVYLSRTNLLGVHNTFLWVAVKMGFLGLLSYLLLHLIFLKHLAQQIKTLRDPFLRTLALGLTCVFTAYVAAQMFAPMFSQMRTSTWFGIILGIGMMLPHYDREQ